MRPCIRRLSSRCHGAVKIRQLGADPNRSRSTSCSGGGDAATLDSRRQAALARYLRAAAAATMLTCWR
jgi:hypothetical protein